MSKEIYDDLMNEARRRSNETQVTAMQQMADLYRGKLPSEYEKYFPSNAPKHIVQLVKNAWNDLASEVGKYPDLVSDPLDETAREEKASGLHERIANNYLFNAEPTGKQFMKQIAFWLVGAGRSIAIVRAESGHLWVAGGREEPISVSMAPSQPPGAMSIPIQQTK